MGWANSAPTDINASNLTIAENSAIGTVIGEFNATDPDGDSNITFSLVTPLQERFEFFPFGWMHRMHRPSHPFQWFGQSMGGQEW